MINNKNTSAPQTNTPINEEELKRDTLEEEMDRVFREITTRTKTKNERKKQFQLEQERRRKEKAEQDKQNELEK